MEGNGNGVPRATNGELELTAWASALEGSGTHSVFVRFVPRSDDNPKLVSDTIDVRWVAVDVDEDGNLLGLHLLWTDST